MQVSLWCEEVEEEVQEEVQEETQVSSGGLSQLRAPWDPTVSGHRVIQRLLQVEQRYLPSTLYVTLIQRDPGRREELAKWTLEVCCDSGCDESVFPLSVSLLDRFLSSSLSLPVSPSCLAAACVFIASKLTECDVITADTLCAAAGYSFLPANLRDMERLILSTLSWDTAAVTPQDFLPHFLASLEETGVQVRDQDQDQNQDQNQDQDSEGLSTLRRHSDTLAAMCSCDSRFLGAPPSLVAAASLNCALRGLGPRSPNQLLVLEEALAELSRTDRAVLQCFSEMIELVLRQRLRTGLHQDQDQDQDQDQGQGQGQVQKEEQVEEPERPGTPTDMRDIEF